MARPIKNSCDYFTHDNGMRNHRKIKSIRKQFGHKGYSFWNMFLEFLTGADGNVFERSEIELELLSGDFDISVTEINEMIDFCIKIELLFVNENFIFSESLNERLAPVYIKRGKSKELSAKQKRINGKYATENTVSTIVSATETPQSIVKETKVKNKVFIPPTVEEIKAYCIERKNTINPQKFFDHYEARDWKPKGYTQRMKNWKAAIRTWENNTQTPIDENRKGDR